VKKIAKGNMAPVWVLIVIVVIFGSIASYKMFWPSGEPTELATQTVLGGTATPEQVTQAELEQNLGKSISIKVQAEDVLSSTRAKVAPPAYCWKASDDTKLLADALTLSTTAGTSVGSLTAAKDDLICEAFNGSYYSEGNKISLAKSDLMVIPVKAIASSVDIKMLTQNNQLLTKNYEYNATSMGVTGSFSFDYIKIWANDTYTGWNFKAIAVDTPAASNISSVSLSNGDEGEFEKGVLALERLKDTDDYVFSLKSAIMMNYDDILKTGVFKLTANGNGLIGSGLAETVTLRFIDEQKYRSNINGNSKAILSGVEDNAPTPADVGASDFTLAFYATSTA
jgi:hypothetical protein